MFWHLLICGLVFICCLFSFITTYYVYRLYCGIRDLIPRRQSRAKESQYTCVYPFEYDNKGQESGDADKDRYIAELERAVEYLKRVKEEEEEEDDLDEYIRLA